PGAILALSHARRHVEAALPWLRLDSTRVYGFGTDRVARMLLLVAARYPWSFAGLAASSPAFDLPTRRRTTQARARTLLVRQLAFSRVPLQLWSADGAVPLYDALK